MSSHLGSISLPSSHKAARKCEWCPPDPGLLRFIVDGASRGNPGDSRVGGVLRNYEGMVLGCFSKNVGCIWAYEAELLAILNCV